jgi:hypothetical protein
MEELILVGVIRHRGQRYNAQALTIEDNLKLVSELPAAAIGRLKDKGLLVPFKEGQPIVQEAPPLAFASAAAKMLAETAGLEPSDFDGLTPSSKSGFTKAQVVDVIQAKG